MLCDGIMTIFKWKNNYDNENRNSFGFYNIVITLFLYIITGLLFKTSLSNPQNQRTNWSLNSCSQSTSADFCGEPPLLGKLSQQCRAWRDEQGRTGPRCVTGEAKLGLVPRSRVEKGTLHLTIALQVTISCLSHVLSWNPNVNVSFR